jgi:lyso-ornithine lipid O-acyltransferase
MWRSIRTSARIASRLAWLSGELAWAAIAYMPTVTGQPSSGRAHARALWLQTTARRLLKVFGIELHVAGMAPGSGLLVSNHLSYLDILILGAISPAVFVAKHELRSWPILGPLMGMAGTIFVDRSRKHSVGGICTRIAQTSRESLVVLFPEGTSSGGESVLPFRSALLAPAAGGACRLTAAWLRYELEDGNAAEDVCYWKDMTFGPHLLNLLSKRQVKAWARLKPVTNCTDRKQLAVALRQEVLALRDITEGKASRWRLRGVRNQASRLGWHGNESGRIATGLSES